MSGNKLEKRNVFKVLLIIYFVWSGCLTVKVVLAGESSPLCINVGGHWEGMLNLVNYTQQPVSATVTQTDCSLRITTTSSLAYGKYFVGSIDDTYIYVQDMDTEEMWTTHSEIATEGHFVLQDYVNNYSDMDELILQKKVIPGDLNGNGALDITDIILGLRIASGSVSLPGSFLLSDINNDQRVGIEEVMYILGHYASK